MPELDVSPVTFKIKATPMARVGVAASTGAQVILVPVPGGIGPQGPPGEGTRVIGETPSGAVNGSNTVYTTATAYLAGSLSAYLNGLRENHFTETTSTTFTFSDPPISGDQILIDYIMEV